jgi:hypothetical protein
VKLKRSADDDVSRLDRYLYPVLGDTPSDRVTLDQCEAVMRALPPTLATATRRNVGQLVTRIMRMAVYPLRLIERSPIPEGFLPTAPQPKGLAYLYPDVPTSPWRASFPQEAHRVDHVSAPPRTCSTCVRISTSRSRISRRTRHELVARYPRFPLVH